MERLRLQLSSQLGQFSKDLRKLSDEQIPEALAKGVGTTLECARDDLQKGLNQAIEGGPATKFISDFAVGWNVGRRGRISTARKTNLPTAKDFTSTMSGRVFIQDKQQVILDAALSNATVSQLEYSSGKTASPFTIPKNLKSLFLRGDSEGRNLILKKNSKGNVIRYKRKALGQLRDAAREQVRGNRPPRKGQGPYSRFNKQPDGAKYFEILRRETGPTGFKFYPGIYRREDNKKAGDKRRTKLFQVVAYQDNLSYSTLGRKFSFDKTALNSLNANFTRKMDRAIQQEVRRTLG